MDAVDNTKTYVYETKDLINYGEEKTVIFTATNSAESEIHLSVTFGGGKDNIAPKFYLRFEPK